MVKYVAKIGGEGPEFPNAFGSEHIESFALAGRSLGGGEGPEINLFGTEHVDLLALGGGEGPEINGFGSENIEWLAPVGPALGGGEGPEINLFGAEHLDSVAPARTAARGVGSGDYGIWTSTPAGQKKAA